MKTFEHVDVANSKGLLVGALPITITSLALPVFAFALLLYFPAYSLSLILGYSFHWVIAACLIASAVVLMCRDLMGMVLLAAAVLLLSIKVILGGFDKALWVALLGFSVIAAVPLLSQLSSAYKRWFVRLAVASSVIVFSIVLLQFLGVLPKKLGQLTFVNHVVGSFGLVEGGTLRPNGYLFHPFDTVLALMPMLYYLTRTQRMRALMALAVAEYVIYLKAWIIWAPAAFITAQFASKKRLQVLLLLLIPLTTLAAWYMSMSDDNLLLAGRNKIWQFYFSVMEYRFSWLDTLIGYAGDIPGAVSFLGVEDVHETHHMGIFLLAQLGWIGAMLFVAQMLYLLRQAYAAESLAAVFLVATLFTLGMTGGLIMFMPFWVGMGLVLAIETLFGFRKSVAE